MPMFLRDALVGVLEWRARRLSDPVDRLQLLRRSAPRGGRRRERTRWGRTEVARGLRYLQMAGIALIVLLVVVKKTTSSPNAAVSPAAAARHPAALTPKAGGPIWLVQRTTQFDLYSNGLRIEEQYATSTAPRRYLAFAAQRGGPIDGGAVWRNEPAGIVYHTTESHLAPFEEEQNQSLRRAGEGLLEYVSRRRAYHFVIDRFGRVFRVVRESDYANHAGNSVWADRYWIYVNLNQSFLGVAFEARSRPSGAETTVNGAQIYAGRILTDMLRSRYGIAASNCVAHAQVSVNPANFGAGYHLDWAANLPFAELGLPDNYRLPLASVDLFGFEPPEKLGGVEGASMAQGLEASQADLRAEAGKQGLAVARYRQKLQERYRDAIQALRGKGAYQEYN
jgi:hypothetical protein